MKVQFRTILFFIIFSIHFNVIGQIPFSEIIELTSSVERPVSVFSVDLDGDGDADVFSASLNDNKIVWHENRLNQAQRDFGPPQLITIQTDRTVSVFAADLDGDGDADVLSASRDDDKILWNENRLNQIEQDFGPQLVISTQVDFTQSVFAVDLDADGDMDVLSSSFNDNKIAWYENRLKQAEKDFSSQKVITTEARGAQSVFAVDLDGDGDADVLSASLSDNKIAWYENRLNQTEQDFGPQQVITTEAIGANSVFAADLDGDGDADVLSASEADDKIAWYENRLNETEQDFSPQQMITIQANFVQSVFAIDLDSDGDVDVLSASSEDDKIAWFENRLNQTEKDFDPLLMISTQAESAQSVIAIDLDGDGDADVLSASDGDDKIAWYENRLNQVEQNFSPQQVITAQANDAKSVFAIDLDGDGDADVLSVSFRNNKIAWHENRLNQTEQDFGPPQVITNPGTDTRSVYAVDLDGDGDADVLSTARDDNTIAWYENRLSQTEQDFGPQQVITTQADNARSVFATDMDGDGDNDIVVGHGDSVSIIYNLFSDLGSVQWLIW